MDCRPRGSSVHGNSPGKNMKWVAMPSCRGFSQPRDRTQVSHIEGWFFTNWATREAQEYWSGSPVPSPGDLPNPGIKPGSPALQVDSLPTELLEIPTNGTTLAWKDEYNFQKYLFTQEDFSPPLYYKLEDRLDFKDSVMSTASIFFHETTRTIRNISLTVCIIKNFCVFFFNFNLDA